MKPRIQCAECGKEIPFGDHVCPHCGVAVEWSGGTDASETAGGLEHPMTCGRCGSENVADASFCNTCGAKLLAGPGKKVSLDPQSAKEGKGRGSKKKSADSTSLFSWKVIFAFLGFLVILVAAVELFSKKEETQDQTQAAASQMPAASIQVAGQITELEKQLSAI